MSSVASIWSAFIVMIVCGIVGVIGAFAFGFALDGIHTGFLDAGVYDLNDTAWGNEYGSTTEPMMGILFIFLYCIPVFGIVVFLLTVFKDRLRRVWK